MAGRGRPRKIPVIEETDVPCETECTETPDITLLSVDYSSEGLNNMARKINEIIEHLNEK